MVPLHRSSNGRRAVPGASSSQRVWLEALDRFCGAHYSSGNGSGAACLVAVVVCILPIFGQYLLNFIILIILFIVSAAAYPKAKKMNEREKRKVNILANDMETATLFTLYSRH